MIVIATTLTLASTVYSHTGGLTTQEVNDLEMELSDLLTDDTNTDGFLSISPYALHVIFHDCAGPKQGNQDTLSTESICDGCLNLDAHHSLNTEAIEPLDEIFINYWDAKISRADYWAFAATFAIKQTFKNSKYLGTCSDDDILPNIAYYFGRKDCSSTPDIDKTTTKPNKLISGSLGWSHLYSWFNSNLDMNVEEIVAIMGGHTIIGTTHDHYHTFDNEYYKQLLDYNNGDLPKWLFDLNVHECLVKDIEDTECAQDNTKCKDNTMTMDFVKKFAADNQAFLDAFIESYIKLITTGYNKDDLVAVSGCHFI